MSRYHPLDVRHPSNLRYANPNYLLSGPIHAQSTPATTAPSRAPAALHSRSDVATQAAARPVQPWGGRSTASPPAAARAKSGSGGFWRTGFWLLIFGGVVLWQNGGLNGALRLVRRLALDFGIVLPF